jgi:hypothetical protein
MKNVITTVYNFAELSDKAKQKAIESLYDCNVNREWWDCTYEDAKTVNIKITGFDIDRSYCEGDFMESAEETANLIIENHGKDCKTYKTAANYLKERKELVEKYSDGKTLNIVAEDNECDFDNDCNELDAEFLRSILEDYRIILSKEYDYLTSKEAIIDTIEANDWTFTEDGTMKNA